MTTKVKLNLQGIREIKRTPAVTSKVEAAAQRVAAAARAAATDDYYGRNIYVNMDTHEISGSVAHVTAGSTNAMRVEAIHGTLARALGAA